MSIFKDNNLFKLKIFDLNKKIEKTYNKYEKIVITKEKPTDQLEMKEFLKSKSSYKQCLRLYLGLDSNSKMISEESKIYIDTIKKHEFNYYSFSGKSVSNLDKLMNDTLQLKDKKLIKNTILQIYFDTLEVLKNKNLLQSINKWYKEMTDMVKNGVNEKSNENDKQKLFKLTYLINNYTCLLFLAESLRAQISGVLIEISTNSTINNNDFFENYLKYFRWFLNHVAINHIPLIVYFKNVDVKNLNKEINKKLDMEKATEDWVRYSLNKIYGVESISLGIVIALGIGLGLTMILPAIRSMIYYWGCLKINASNYYTDESIYLSYNIRRLREELMKETNEEKKEKLRIIIEQQEIELEKLKNKAHLLSIGFEENVAQVEKTIEYDEVNEEEIYENPPEVLL